MNNRLNYETIIEAVNNDKKFILPSIGETSCSRLKELYTFCLDKNELNRQKLICSEYKDFSTQCFLMSKKEIRDHIEAQQREHLGLVEFLERNGSSIPSLLRKNGNINHLSIFFNEKVPEEPQPSSLEKKGSALKELVSDHKSFFKSNI